LDKAFNRFHAGSKGLYRFICSYRPRLLLCGHIHESAGTATIDKTIVVNCNIARKNGGAIVEIAAINTSGGYDATQDGVSNIVGTRAVGSSAERKISLHEPEVDIEANTLSAAAPF